MVFSENGETSTVHKDAERIIQEEISWRGGGDLPVHLVALLGEIDPRLMMVEKYMFVALRQ